MNQGSGLSMDSLGLKPWTGRICRDQDDKSGRSSAQSRSDPIRSSFFFLRTGVRCSIHARCDSRP